MGQTDYVQGVQAERFDSQLREARASTQAQAAVASAHAWKDRATLLERRLVASQAKVVAVEDEATVLAVTRDVALANLAEIQAALAVVAPNHPLAKANEMQLKRRGEIDRRLVAHGMVLDRSDPRANRIIKTRR
jgi:ATP-dependent helicase YprA (DUF1998 family)